MVREDGSLPDSQAGTFLDYVLFNTALLRNDSTALWSHFKFTSSAQALKGKVMEGAKKLWTSKSSFSGSWALVMTDFQEILRDLKEPEGPEVIIAQAETATSAAIEKGGYPAALRVMQMVETALSDTPDSSFQGMSIEQRRSARKPLTTLQLFGKGDIWGPGGRYWAN